MYMIRHNHISVNPRNGTRVRIHDLSDFCKLCVRADVVIGPYDCS